MKFVADTSAIISLGCSNYFENIKSEFDIILTPLVIDELEEFGIYEDYLGEKASLILKEKFITKKPKNLIALKLGSAECEVFSLANEEKRIALTDDIHAARVVYEKLKLKTKPSFYLLILLFNKQEINKNDLINDMRQILKNRNWISGSLWEYALDMIEQL